MADQEFTGQDLAALARKLDDLSKRLTDRERAMLLAVFQMAGDQLNQLSGGGGGTGGLESVSGFAMPETMPTLKIANIEALPSLSAGFRNSFTRGGVSDLALTDAIEWDASVSVMGGGM